MTITAKVPKKGWAPGGIESWGTRLVVRVETPSPVSFIYEITRGQYRFLGIERVIPGHDEAECAPTKEHLGSTAVSRTVWMRVYKEDKRRRSFYEENHAVVWGWNAPFRG